MRDEPSLFADAAIYAANLSTDEERRDHHRESRHRLRRLSSRQQQLGRSRPGAIPPEEGPQPPVQFSVNCPPAPDPSERDLESAPAPVTAMCRPYQEGQHDSHVVYTDNHPELLSPTPPLAASSEASCSPPPGAGPHAVPRREVCGAGITPPGRQWGGRG